MLEPAPEPMEPPAVQPPVVLPVERAAAALEVILCSGYPTQIVVGTLLATFGLRPYLEGGGFNTSFVFALTLLDTVLLVGLVCFFFRAHRESIREQLFGTREFRRELILGLLLIPASFAVIVFVLLIVHLAAPSLRNVPDNPFAALVKTRVDVVIFALLAMIGGGVREEIQRGFVLRRFEQFLGGGRAGLIIFSCVFGLGHMEQGRDVAIATAVLGAFWGFIFLRRRSIAAPIVGHAGFNLLQIAKFLVLGS